MRRLCDCCGRIKVIAQQLATATRLWQWCAICAEKLERARGLVLDCAERERAEKDRVSQIWCWPAVLAFAESGDLDCAPPAPNGFAARLEEPPSLMSSRRRAAVRVSRPFSKNPFGIIPSRAGDRARGSIRRSLFASFNPTNKKRTAL